METVNIRGSKCRLEFGLYPNNTVAITALRASDDALWLTPTVNWERHFKGRNYRKDAKFPAVVIKNYGENQGVYKDLLDAGVITVGFYLSGTGGTVQMGFLKDKWQQMAKPQLRKISKKNK